VDVPNRATDVCAQVEDKIARVPRAIFRDSPVFNSMVTFPQPPGGPVDGSDLAHPLKLESVSAADLEVFVKAAVPQ
jgi:hypothetical protein